MSLTILGDNFSETELRMILKLKSEHIQILRTKNKATITVEQLRDLKPSFQKQAPRLLQPRGKKQTRAGLPIEIFNFKITVEDITRKLVRFNYKERTARFHLQNHVLDAKSIMQDIFGVADLVDPGRDRKSPFYNEFTWEFINKKARMQAKKLKRIFGDDYESYRALGVAEKRTPEEIYKVDPLKFLPEQAKIIKTKYGRVKHDDKDIIFYKTLEDIDYNFSIIKISEHVHKFTTYHGETIGWKINDELYYETYNKINPIDRPFFILPTKNNLSLSIIFMDDIIENESIILKENAMAFKKPENTIKFYNRSSTFYIDGTPYLRRGILYGNFVAKGL